MAMRQSLQAWIEGGPRGRQGQCYNLALTVKIATRVRTSSRSIAPLFLFSRLPVIASALVLQLFFVRAVSSDISQTTEGISLDRYGGVRALHSPRGGTGRFRVEKFGSHWMFVTPDGNAFWMLGVQNITPSGSITDGKIVYDNVILTKYGNREEWGEYQVQRLKFWGFNTVADYSSTKVYPFGRTQAHPTILPVTFLANFANPSLTNQMSYGSGYVKGLIDGLDQTYIGYRSEVPDFFDPKFGDYVAGKIKQTLADGFWRETFTNPWVLGVSMDDTDYLYGFGPGPEVPSVDRVIHAHIGWIALCTNPNRSLSRKYSVAYKDTKVYSKYALRDFLAIKYKDSIAALNSAWGSSYTTFDSAGAFGSGTGLLDENGRHTAWLGSTDGTLTDASAGASLDLDAFLYQFAAKYFSVIATNIRRHVPWALIFSPNTLNGHGGLTRGPILRAAGEYCDVIQAGIRDQRTLDLTVHYAGDKPISTWEGWPANPDSSLWKYPNPTLGQENTFQTQTERGTNYRTRINFLFNANSSGTYPVVGIKWWEYVDNWGEKTNWGLVDFLDNAYDGRQSTISPSTDTWGFPRGGDEHNYGDFLSAVRNTNSSILQAIASRKLK